MRLQPVHADEFKPNNINKKKLYFEILKIYKNKFNELKGNHFKIL